MIHTLKLLLPALLPSWNFFDVIAASPRIQFCLLTDEYDKSPQWNEFRPRPEKLTFVQMLKRILWNPQWNESLFMISCAERIIEHTTPEASQHSEDEILKRIIHELTIHNLNPAITTNSCLQFRLLLVQRQGRQLQQDIVFLSRIQALYQ